MIGTPQEGNKRKFMHDGSRNKHSSSWTVLADGGQADPI